MSAVSHLITPHLPDPHSHVQAELDCLWPRSSPPSGRWIATGGAESAYRRMERNPWKCHVFHSCPGGATESRRISSRFRPSIRDVHEYRFPSASVCCPGSAPPSNEKMSAQS